MQLDQYMVSFEKELGIPGSLKNEKTGKYLLPLDEGIKIFISPLPSGFSCFTELSFTQPKNEETFYYQLLKANLFGNGTKGALLGLNDQGNMLTISRLVDYNVDYQNFKGIIEDFITTLDYWNEHIQGFKTP